MSDAAVSSRSLPGATIALTLLALLAFAANSLLCRLALGAGHIDAASFTTLRLLSGAIVLALLVLLRATGRRSVGGSWPAAFALALYAVPFSFAYLRLTAGSGALLLFGAVQGTMLAAGLAAGERPGAATWSGFAAALAGLLVLVAPGVTAPEPFAALLMAASGIAWGVYSLLGRGASEPTAATAGNFLRAAPLAALVSLAGHAGAHLDRTGVVLAIVSGAVTSGLGYVLWYQVLPQLGAVRAAIAQLAAPAFAAIGGVAFLGEAATARLIGAAALILGGVGLALRARTSDR
ncbi:MAG TPA: DMT family transporter [Candidatus Polarisedimenticolia bacterium]|nr:DMT family transporter [Candidatus Polarisedimenticolia bacterium]